MRRFTNSELTTWRTCRRQWWLRYYRKLAPAYDGPEVSAAGLGTMVHGGLELYHISGRPHKALAWLANFTTDQMSQEGLTDFQRKACEKQARLAYTMLEGYFEWLEETGADHDLEFLAAERAVEVQIDEDVSVLGKLDARVRKRSTGEIRFLDNKTVQSIDATVEAAYRSNQFRHYAWLQSQLAEQEELAGGVIVNMLRKVGRGPTSKPPFYGRHEFSFNKQIVASYWQQLIAEIDRIEEATVLLGRGDLHHALVPPSPSRDCSWRCEFKTICPMFDDGSDVETVIAWGFRESDPLARYETEKEESPE